MAATQMSGIGFDEAYKKLLAAIDEFYETRGRKQ